MRLPVWAVMPLLIASGFFGENQAAAAQSEDSYPWCGCIDSEGAAGQFSAHGSGMKSDSPMYVYRPYEHQW